ncbi:unnamed protein product, partial [Prunus brigantina]
MCHILSMSITYFKGMTQFSSSTSCESNHERALTTPFPVRSTQQAFHKVHACRPASVSASDDVFTWADVVRISKPETLPDDPTDLKGYSEKIKICNCPFLDKLYNTFSPLPNRNRPIVRL